MDADQIWAVVTMPQGTPVEETRKVVEKLEASVGKLQKEIDAERGPDRASLVKHISTTIGQHPFDEVASRGLGALPSTISRSHLAEVYVEIVSGEDRKITSTQIARRWRELTGEIPGVSKLIFRSEFFSAGEAVNVELSHQNFNTLLLAAENLKEQLAGLPGVTDIADSFEPGKIELKLTLTDLGRASGLTLSDLARQVRQGFYGDEVQRVQRGRDDIKVMVRYPEAERSSLADIENMRIRLPDGTELPFRLVAHVEEGRGYAQIDRTDRRRVVSVTAGVNDEIANANEINGSLRDTVLPEIQSHYPGLYYRFEGEQREQQKSMMSLGRNMAIALLGIFILLAVQFRSYVQPLIVMSAIPFGLVGALLGHLIMGFNLSMLSLFGFVALAGVVVNDSLVMIDLANRLRRMGLPLDLIILQSGTRRFRPILLTTATTFLGLTPMILEKSLQARFLIPMAVSLGFGVVFATLITLVLVPALYRILEDIKSLLGISGDSREELLQEADADPEPVETGAER
jgi:multidrug efflux pump subunit AcrB